MSFHIDDRMKKFLPILRCCWISSTGTGYGTDSSIERGELPAYFKHENLNILFRSATHISTITSKYIEKRQNGLPFPVETVKIPGCFTAEQRKVLVWYVRNVIESLFNGRNLFLGDNFSSRLIVILSSAGVSIEDNIDQLKSKWKATEVVLNEYSLREISGSEFQSVLLAIDRTDDYILNDVTLAISRAQYEVGIIVNEELTEFRELLSTYVSPETKNYSTLFHNFLDENVTFTNWLAPQDCDITQALEWWIDELRKLMRGNLTQTIMQKPITIRLQLTTAFPSLFRWPSPTSPAKLNEGWLNLICVNINCHIFFPGSRCKQSKLQKI